MAIAPVANRLFHKIYVPPEDYESQTWKGHPANRINPTYVLDVHKVGQPYNFNKAVENGNQIKPYIKSLSFEEDEKLASVLNIEFNDPDFVISDSDFVGKGNSYGIQFGYGINTVSLNRRVELIASYPQFPESGTQTYQVRGYDGRHVMTGEDFLPGKRSDQRFGKTSRLGANLPKKPRKGLSKVPMVFKNKTDSQIISEIAGYFDFCVDTDITTTRRTTVKKKDSSFWQFILRLAKRNNYTAWVDWDAPSIWGTYGKWCLHFRKKQEGFSAGYEFVYRKGGEGTILTASLHEELTRQSTDVEIVNFDKRLKKVGIEFIDGKEPFTSQKVKYTRNLKAGSRPNTLDFYGANVKFRVGGRTIKIFADRPLKSKKDAGNFVENYLKQQQEDFMVLEATVLGTENLRPRQVHRFDGLGRFSGEYYLTQVKHRFNDNSVYKTEIIGYRLVPSFVYLKKKALYMPYPGNVVGSVP